MTQAAECQSQKLTPKLRQVIDTQTILDPTKVLTSRELTLFTITTYQSQTYSCAPISHYLYSGIYEALKVIHHCLGRL